MVTFDHEHVPTDHLHALDRRRASPCRPGPEALVHAQDKVVMRARLGRARRARARGTAVVADADVADVRRRRRRLPVRAQDRRAAATTARASGSSRPPDECATAFAAAAATGVRDPGRGAGRLPARAVRAGGPLARSGQAAAYPVVESVQRDGICREVDRARRPASTRRARRRRRSEIALRIAARARRDRHPRRRAVRDRRRPGAGQRARDAPAQHRALDPGRRGHLAVREPPARRARPAARLARRPRARGR